jgi:hypothetical protein
VLVRALALAFASLTLLGAGCGGSGAGPDQTVRNYFEAIVDQNGQRACNQLTAALQKDIEGSAAARSGGRSCADVMQLASGLNPGLSSQDVEDLDIEVTEDGDQATASFENPLSRRHETIDLIQSGDDWKISTLKTRPTG